MKAPVTLLHEYGSNSDGTNDQSSSKERGRARSSITWIFRNIHPLGQFDALSALRQRSILGPSVTNRLTEIRRDVVDILGLIGTSRSVRHFNVNHQLVCVRNRLETQIYNNLVIGVFETPPGPNLLSPIAGL